MNVVSDQFRKEPARCPQPTKPKNKQSRVSAKLEGYEPSTTGAWDDYPIDELATRDERRTAEDVVRRIDKGRFVLGPDFQRGFVWDK